MRRTIFLLVTIPCLPWFSLSSPSFDLLVPLCSISVLIQSLRLLSLVAIAIFFHSTFNFFFFSSSFVQRSFSSFLRYSLRSSVRSLHRYPVSVPWASSFVRFSFVPMDPFVHVRYSPRWFVIPPTLFPLFQTFVRSLSHVHRLRSFVSSSFVRSSHLRPRSIFIVQSSAYSLRPRRCSSSLSLFNLQPTALSHVLVVVHRLRPRSIFSLQPHQRDLYG